MSIRHVTRNEDLVIIILSLVHFYSLEKCTGLFPNAKLLIILDISKFYGHQF